MSAATSHQMPLRRYLPDVSRIAFGCMGLGGRWDHEPVDQSAIHQAHEVIDTVLESGINLIDHADIYTFGKAEQAFGQVLKQRPELRQQLYIQSKCGIRFADEQGPKRYDFSAEWLQHSVDGILNRLGIEQLDLFLLHRPDPLLEPEIVAEVFQRLHKQGKVAHFGVSNMHHYQISFLQRHLSLPLVINQLDLSLAQLGWLEEGVLAGNPDGSHINFAPGTLEYCRSEGIQLQSWGSLAQGKLSGRDVSNEPQTIQRTAGLVYALSEQYRVSREAIVLAFLMRHPAAIQPLIGTTHPGRIRACAQAVDIQLSREDWYRLYEAARGVELP